MVSIIMLLGGAALIRFALGRYDYPGWKGLNLNSYQVWHGNAKLGITTLGHFGPLSLA
jgi:hypothetical protein